MSCSRYYFGFYWGPRRATAVECAEVGYRFASKLSKIIGSRKRWRHVTEKKPRLIDSLATARIAMAEGVSRDDLYGRVVPDCGYTNIWYQQVDHKYCISMTIGMGMYSPYVPNAIVINWPADPVFVAKTLTPDRVYEILNTGIEYFDPYEATISDTELFDEVGNVVMEVCVGWVTYLKEPPKDLSKVPNGVEIADLGGSGKTFVVWPDKTKPPDRDAIPTMRQLRKWLKRTVNFEYK